MKRWSQNIFLDTKSLTQNYSNNITNLIRNTSDKNLILKIDWNPNMKKKHTNYIQISLEIAELKNYK